MDLAELELGRAVSGLTEANVALTRCGLWNNWLPSQIVRPCVPSADTALGSALTLHRWQTGSILPHAWNKVPSRSMACMMTASRRASATRGALQPSWSAEASLLPIGAGQFAWRSLDTARPCLRRIRSRPAISPPLPDPKL